MDNKKNLHRFEHPGSVRSYVIRAARLTVAQRKALHSLLPKFEIPVSREAGKRIDVTQTFGRMAAATLEIGFGNGEALIEMAQSSPHEDFVGIEVHKPGIGHLLLRIRDEGLQNVRVIQGDAVEVLSRSLLERQFDRICLFFPDPWPKKRHHKRRILQPYFIQLVVDNLKTGGLFHFATDWQDYACYALELLEGEVNLENIAGSGFIQNQGLRPMTKFERRGQKLGYGVWDIILRKC